MGTTNYQIQIEIYEGDKCDHHQPGQIFNYPEETGQICPWLMDSLNSMIRVLQFGGSLPWEYEGTPYEKQIQANGETTEFVRCPDPTRAGVVAKITRTRLAEKKEVGWT